MRTPPTSPASHHSELCHSGGGGESGRGESGGDDGGGGDGAGFHGGDDGGGDAGGNGVQKIDGGSGGFASRAGCALTPFGGFGGPDQRVVRGYCH